MNHKKLPKYSKKLAPEEPSKPSIPCRNTYSLNNKEATNSGVYNLKCIDCPLLYIGQTGRLFQTTYKKNIYVQSDITNTYPLTHTTC
jgi:hypothetical protein